MFLGKTISRKEKAMIEKTLKDFLADAENLVMGAAVDDAFVKIATGNGNAVLISEAEWNILLEAMKKVLQDA